MDADRAGGGNPQNLLTDYLHGSLQALLAGRPTLRGYMHGRRCEDMCGTSAPVQSKGTTVIAVRIDASGYVAPFNALREL